MNKGFFEKLREIIELHNIDVNEIEYLLIFFKALVRKHQEHYPKKKDTWKKIPLIDLRDMLIKEFKEYFGEYEKEKFHNPNELLDIAMFCSFLYNRGLEN